MRIWLVLLVSCAYLVLSAEEDKHLLPVLWKGSLTKIDNTGQKVYNGITTRAQIFEDKAFLCNPRIKHGIEATLLKMDMFPNERNDHEIEPFPKLQLQTEGDCECLQSAVDVTLDREGTLWILDVGVTFEELSQPVSKCPPKVLGINIHTGKVEKKIDLASLVGPTSRLQFIVVDFSQEGNRFLCLSDAGAKALIVWDVENNKGTKILLPENTLDELKTRDVLYISLIRKHPGSNLLYYTYRSGDDMFCIETKQLRNTASCKSSRNVGKKPAKMIILGTDEWESIYFRYENTTDIYKWNTTNEFNVKNYHLVNRGRSTLAPTHVIPDYKRGVMRMLESNLVDYLTNKVNPSDSLNSLATMSVT